MTDLQRMRRMLENFAKKYPVLDGKVVARGRWLRLEYNRLSDGKRVYTNYHGNTVATLAMNLADFMDELREKEEADAKATS